MVTRLTDYTKQFWILLSTDDMDTLGSHNGDEAIVIDQDKRYVFDEENQTWRQIPMSGGGGGGGETVYYNRNGVQYTKKMSIPVSNNGAFPRYDYCDLLEEVEVYPASGAQLDDVAAPVNTFSSCNSLKRAVIRVFHRYGHNFFRGCTALEDVSLGDIGVPVTALGSLAFSGDTQAGLTITLYVSDDTARPIAGSPWGATNATIIYRSSTTGEVLT